MEYRAKKTNYGGRWFKSNLEAKTAEAFDRLGIRWEYESRCFRDYRYSGGQYTPDFWLSDVYTYIEVVGRPDQRHASNAALFCKTQGIPTEGVWNVRTLSEDNPDFALIVGDGTAMRVNSYEENGLTRDCGPVICENCGKIHFIDGTGSWSCPHCGNWSKSNQGMGNNLFELAGIHA